MTLRLSVDRTAWDAHVDAVDTAVEGLVPVVKGNGYGLTRAWLAQRAALRWPIVAVGSVWEVADVPVERIAVVLTPALRLPDDLPEHALLTVASVAHLDALRAHRATARVVIKLRSSMDRYGSTSGEIDAMLRTARHAGHEVAGFALHLPLVGTDDDRVGEIERWLLDLPAGSPLSVSHLSPATFAALQLRHRDRDLSLRIGTALWHGDKSAFRLEADVVDRRTVASGSALGYRLGTAAGGELLLVGAGTAQGVTPLPDGRSPFHFARRRLDLHEAPHMHTSMVTSPGDAPLPRVGEWVDVQRPLTAIIADVIDWT